MAEVENQGNGRVSSTDILDKVQQWYELRQERGREITFGDLMQREDALQKDMTKLDEQLNDLTVQIHKMAASLGIEFDDKTGTITIKKEKQAPDQNVDKDPNSRESDSRGEITPTGSSNQNNVENKTAESLSQDLYKTRARFDETRKELYGQTPNQNEPDSQQEKKQGVIELIKEKRLSLLQRDALAKRVLQELVTVQAAKDAMDMCMAKHVAEKRLLMHEIARTKMDIVQRVASGATKDDMSIQVLQVKLAGLVNQVSNKEDQFEVAMANFTSSFNGAKTALKDANKQLKVAREGKAGDSNYYVTTNYYSEDGILESKQLEGALNGSKNTVHEQEVYNQDNMMINGEDDSKEHSVSFDINGTTVRVSTKYPSGGNEHVSTAQLGETDVLEVSTAGSVEELPDIDEQRDVEKTEEMLEQTAPEPELTIEVGEDGERKYHSIDEVGESEDRKVVGTALRFLGLVDTRNPGVLVAPNIANLEKIIAEKVIELAQENIPIPGFPPIQTT